MNSYLSLIEQLHLDPTILVLTANRRLASQLMTSYQAEYMQADNAAWQTPSILPLSSWFENCYQELLERNCLQHLLLKPYQALTIWENIINQSIQSHELLQPQECAKTTQTAWELLTYWQVPLNESLFNHDEDSTRFYQWTKAFQAYCLKHQFLDTAQLPEKIIFHLEQGDLQLPKTIYFFGFLEFPPLFQTFINVAKEKNIRCETILPTQAESQTYYLPLNNYNEELIAMAQWAYQLVENGESGLIGCVIPLMSELHDEASRIFKKIATKDQNASFTYNISGGRALSEYAIVYDALQILKLGSGTLHLNEFSRLLLSPYLYLAEQEMEQRAKIDEELLTNYYPQIDIKTLIILLKNTSNSTSISEKLQQYYDELCQTPKQQLPSEWLVYFNHQLTCLGWPGERILNSIEYQLFSRFRELFEEFAALDWVMNKIDLYTAITKFQEIAATTLFQEKTPQAQVQVLGLLEATAIPFTQLWIMGLDDETWPSKANPNPFIPFSLQRQYKLPHANAQRELNFSENMMELFTHTANHVICSYAKMAGENTLTPSPLIKNFLEITPDFFNLNFGHSIDLCRTELESIEDNFGPPLVSKEITRGGSYLFKLQALCPFRSFAEIRLWASPFAYSDFGMAATERGSLLHRTLEQLWKNLISQTNLHSYSDNDLKNLIDTLIDEVGQTFFDISRQTHQTQFLLLEKQRLSQLLNQWMLYEKQRSSFTVVATEEPLTATIADIQVKMKIDRIDLLETGEYIIIDYKTGKTNGRDLFSDRPSEPQLPLYCLAHSYSSQGLVFAQIRADEMHVKGVIAKEDIIPNVKTVTGYSQYTSATNWQEQLTAWHTALTQLAKQYQSGYAAVDPKDPKETCTYCHLQSLCRIYDNPQEFNSENNDGNS